MQIFQVDAFTATPFSGNPASVVLGADGAGDGQLQAIAREFAHAETAFVLAPDGGDHDVRLRFFNARKEAAFVGHATIAAHAVLLSQGLRAPGVLRQKSGTGIIEVDARRGDAGMVFEFRQGAPELGAPLPIKNALRVAQALRLPGELLHAQLPARVARKGNSRLLLPVARQDALDRLQPDFEQLLALGMELKVEGFFVIAVSDPARNEVRTWSRMFCPALGIPEDPVSGNAHAMLAAHLWEQGWLERTRPQFSGFQGAQAGRPGRVEVRLELEDQRMLAARIGGEAVIISGGRLFPAAQGQPTNS
jgi:PhzF family phenazine biosynthesis protein